MNKKEAKDIKNKVQNTLKIELDHLKNLKIEIKKTIEMVDLSENILAALEGKDFGSKIVESGDTTFVIDEGDLKIIQELNTMTCIYCNKEIDVNSIGGHQAICPERDNNGESNT